MVKYWLTEDMIAAYLRGTRVMYIPADKLKILSLLLWVIGEEGDARPAEGQKVKHL